MARGCFVVIDGLGGSGKSTQVELLKKHLGRDVIFTHEPGGAPRAERIRAILKSGAGPAADPLADFFLFWAARAEHMHKKIIPALQAGKTVVCDRFDSSTYAMQVCGERRLHLEKLFWQCRARTLERYAPDLYVILDAPSHVAKGRRQERGIGEDRFDERGEGYQARVRAGYRRFARGPRVRGVVVSARLSRDAVHAEILDLIRKVR